MELIFLHHDVGLLGIFLSLVPKYLFNYRLLHFFYHTKLLFTQNFPNCGLPTSRGHVKKICNTCSISSNNTATQSRQGTTIFIPFSSPYPGIDTLFSFSSTRSTKQHTIIYQKNELRRLLQLSIKKNDH